MNITTYLTAVCIYLLPLSLICIIAAAITCIVCRIIECKNNVIKVQTFDNTKYVDYLDDNT